MIGEVAGAALLYGAASVGLAWLSARVPKHAGHSVVVWLWEHFYLPLLRAAALAGFILLAYPGLFGVAEGPGVGALIADGHARVSHLLGVVFLLSLALPAVPVVGGPALALPVQGAAGSALVFHWLAEALGVPAVGYWPGTPALLGAAALAYGAWWAAGWAASALELTGRRLWNVADAGEVAYQALLLFLQAPALLVYSLGLGRQLGA
ncbi:MAG: hypothetical protein MUF66_10905 [Gammaproteobacteria bacterium]|nr:hypothetical protein [Gammaproteobacteria bacterium]